MSNVQLASSALAMSVKLASQRSSGHLFISNAAVHQQLRHWFLIGCATNLSTEPHLRWSDLKPSHHGLVREENIMRQESAPPSQQKLLLDR